MTPRSEMDAARAVLAELPEVSASLAHSHNHPYLYTSTTAYYAGTRDIVLTFNVQPSFPRPEHPTTIEVTSDACPEEGPCLKDYASAILPIDGNLDIEIIKLARAYVVDCQNDRTFICSYLKGN